VYAHFATNQDLFLALMDRQRQQQEQALEGLAQAGRSVREAMADLGQVAAPTDPERGQWGLLTLEFLLYALREPSSRAQLAQRFEAMRVYLSEQLAPYLVARAGPQLDARDLASVAIALSAASVSRPPSSRGLSRRTCTRAPSSVCSAEAPAWL
jgi:AcrR family transcriptional regulator